MRKNLEMDLDENKDPWWEYLTPSWLDSRYPHQLTMKQIFVGNKIRYAQKPGDYKQFDSHFQSAVLQGPD